MNASPPAASCPACGAESPPGAAFCPACGARRDAGGTERAELPPHETGPVPVAFDRVEPRLFGVTPPTLLFGLAASALTLGGFLLVLGHWILGVAAFALAVLLLTTFLQVARRKPDAALARTSVEVVDSLRARAGYAAQALRTRSSARRETLRLRTELMQVAATRAELLHALGDATYRDDGDAVEALKTELRELDQRTEGVEREIGLVTEQARARIEDAALEVQPTEILGETDRRRED